MAFPATPSNNDVHKEGNRAFAYDSALGVWDQVRETDRTLYGNVPATDITFPPGHVIQIRHSSFNSERGNSTNGWYDTGLEGSITLSSTTNKILVVFSINGVGKETNNTSTYIAAKYRIGTGGWGNDISYGNRTGLTGSSLKQNVGSVAGTYIISPATTTQVGVKFQFASQSNNANAQVQESSATSQLTLMEVVG